APGLEPAILLLDDGVPAAERSSMRCGTDARADARFPGERTGCRGRGADLPGAAALLASGRLLARADRRSGPGAPLRRAARRRPSRRRGVRIRRPLRTSRHGALTRDRGRRRTALPISRMAVRPYGRLYVHPAAA